MTPLHPFITTRGLERTLPEEAATLQRFGAMTELHYSEATCFKLKKNLTRGSATPALAA